MNKKGFSLISSLIAMSMFSVSFFIFLESFKNSKKIRSISLDKNQSLIDLYFLKNLFLKNEKCSLFIESIYLKKMNLSEFEIPERILDQYQASFKSLDDKTATLGIKNKKSELYKEISLHRNECVDKKHESEKLKIICDASGGSLSDDQCLFSSKKAVTSHEDKEVCLGNLETDISEVSNCSVLVNYTCKSEESCSEESEQICRGVHGGQSFELSLGDEFNYSSLSADCDVKDLSDTMGDRVCEDDKQNQYQCPWDKECSTNSNGGECFVPKYVKCEDDKGLAWFCPTHLNEYGDYNKGTKPHQFTQEAGGSEFAVQSSLRDSSFYTIGSKVYQSLEFTPSDLDTVRTISCAKTHGSCR